MASNGREVVSYGNCKERPVCHLQEHTVGDLNGDGIKDEVVCCIDDNNGCLPRLPREVRISSPQGLFPLTLKEGPSMEECLEGRSVFVTTSSLPRSDHLDSSKVSVGAIPGQRLFAIGDLVTTGRGNPSRIIGFAFEFSNATFIRSAALLSEDNEPFDVSALILVSPVSNLDTTATTLVRGLQGTRAYARLMEIHRHVGVPFCENPNQEEVQRLKHEITDALEQKMTALPLDDGGKKLLRERIPAKLALERSISGFF